MSSWVPRLIGTWCWGSTRTYSPHFSSLCDGFILHKAEGSRWPLSKLPSSFLPSCLRSLLWWTSPSSLSSAWKHSEEEPCLLCLESYAQKGMASHSTILVWRIPWAKEPIGSQRGGQDWSDLTCVHVIWPSNPTSGHTHQGNQIWKRHMHPNVHCSTVCHSQDMEAT